jgi:hypothetical protein
MERGAIMGYKFDDELYQGSNCHNAKLTEDIVRKAREEYRAAQAHIMALRKEHSIASYAKKYGVYPTTMERALSGKNWSHV